MHFTHCHTDPSFIQHGVMHPSQQEAEVGEDGDCFCGEVHGDTCAVCVTWAHAGTGWWGLSLALLLLLAPGIGRLLLPQQPDYMSFHYGRECSGFHSSLSEVLCGRGS